MRDLDLPWEDLPAWMMEYTATHRPGCANYFRQAMTRLPHYALESPAARGFFVEEPEGFRRLYFLARDAASAAAAAEAVPRDRPLVIALPQKSPQPALREALLGAGFTPHETFRRMVCRPPPAGEPDAETRFATSAEAAAIREAMPRDYDPYVSHFPSAEELVGWAAKQWVLVARHDGAATGHVIYRLHARHANFNYVRSDPAHPRDALLLMRQLHGEWRKQEVASAELWLRQDNHPLIRLYQFFGWKFDGLTAEYLVRPSHAPPPS